jgi:radical SAM superfamily enzyme YgiQ (UPF0313 family)
MLNKILLVSPQYPNPGELFWNFSYAIRRLGAPIKTPSYQLSLPLIASIIKQIRVECSVQIIDENVKSIDFHFGKVAYDLVCISSNTLQITRALELAGKIRKENPDTIILLGGPHLGHIVDDEIISELINFVDSIVIGESENIWITIFHDIERDNLQDIYFGDKVLADLKRLPIPSFELLPLNSYLFRNIEFSRGCTRQCFFCIEKNKIRFKNPDQVIDEIKYLRNVEDSQGASHKSIFFTDSLLNPIKSEEIVKKFMRELVRYKEEKYLGDQLSWDGQVDINIGNKESGELLELMARAGAKRFLIGFESFYYDKFNKNYKPASLKRRYSNVIKNIRKCGIDVIGSFIIGFDFEPENILQEIEDFITDTGLVLVQINVLTPFPGTDAFTELRGDRRLFKENGRYDWNRFTSTNFMYTLNGNGLARRLNYVNCYKRIFEDASIELRKNMRPPITKFVQQDYDSEELILKSIQDFTRAI